MPPPVPRQILNDATILALPERWISVLVTSSGSMFFSPEVRSASTAVGATFCGGAGGGGGGGGAGVGTPLPVPLATPFGSPPSTPSGSPYCSLPAPGAVSTIFSGSFTGWTVSVTFFLVGAFFLTASGFLAPLSGGGGGGGANPPSEIRPLGSSSFSTSQIDLIHIVITIAA